MTAFLGLLFVSCTADTPTSEAQGTDAGRRPRNDAADVPDSSLVADAADAAASLDGNDACVLGPRALDRLGDDGGGGLSRGCIQCIVTGCSAEFDQCMSDCVCNAVATELVRCLQTDGVLLDCVGSAQRSPSPVVQGVVDCAGAQTQCFTGCGI